MALVQCLFVGNRAGVTGGALAICSNGIPRIRNCTFVQNEAIVGSAVYAEGNVSIENSIIAFCGPGAGVEVFGLPGLRCCDIYGNSGGDWVGEIDHMLGVNGNFSEDPLFCNVSGRNFSLRPQSPCSPGNNQECGLIGTGPVGCNAAGLEQGVDPETSFQLLPCAPNPFRDATRIVYTVGRTAPGTRVQLQILNTTGRVIRTVGGDSPDSGIGFLTWDGRNSAGNRVAQGAYLYRLTIGGESRAGRVLLMR